MDIISELKHVQFSDAIAQLIHDRDISVKRMAISTARKPYEQYAAFDYRLVSNRQRRKTPPKAFSFMAIPCLKTQAAEHPPCCKIKWAIYKNWPARVKGKHSTAFLMKELNTIRPNQKTKSSTLCGSKNMNPMATRKRTPRTFAGQRAAGRFEKDRGFEKLPEFNDSAIVQRSIYIMK